MGTFEGELEGVCLPVDIWVDGSEPWLAKDKVILGEGVDNGIQLVRIVEMSKVKLGLMVRQSGRAIG